MSESIEPELLDQLVCPISKCPLILDGDYLVSTDKNTRRRYRIVDGIPDMLVEESEEMDLMSWQKIVDRQ